MNGKEITDKGYREQSPACIRKYIWMTGLFWTIFVVSVLSWNIYHYKSGTLEIARDHARASFEKDLVYRRWAAKHGGVYVPVTKDTPPNPYLSYIEDRDITTPSGRQLTLMNPAYMTRQVFKMGAEQYGLRGHITSLNPLRPENVPDSWERRVLEGFEKSPVEVVFLEKIDGQPYMRLMKPLITEQSCLKCHASQGYNIGDIRGGLSVSVPMEPIWAIANADLKKMIVGYSAIWFLGLIGIGTASKQIKNRITLHNQAEEELRLHSEIMNNMSEGVYLVGAENGMIIYANPKFEKIFGYNAGEMNGQHFSIVNAPTEKNPMETAREIMDMLNKTGEWHGEVKNIQKDGTSFWCYANCSKFNHPKYGKVIVAIHTDITKRKQAEKQLIHAKDEAEKLNDQLIEATARANDMAAQAEWANMAKSQFLANMSHEIRTPMNAIIGFSDLMSEEDLTDEQKQDVNIIRESGHNLLTLINDILDFSKIEAGQLVIETIDCSLGKLLNSVESLMRPKAAKKEVEFKIIKSNGLPAQIRSDPTRLQQCLINLVGNAIKFTNRGHVRVNVFLEDKNDQPYIRFDVADTGIGIPYDKQEMIFELFTQANGDTTRKYGGTGLGLAITKQLAVLLEGELTLTSEARVGSVFSLTIPANVDVTKQAGLNGKTSDSASNISADEQAVFSGRVLVTEDSPTNQILMKVLLGKMGFDVEIAEDGNQALQKVLTGQFDLIFMDIQMPHMDGYEAAKAIRKEQITTPIIALTANAMKGDDKKCLEAGCDEYLAKPIDRRELLKIIGKYLPAGIELAKQLSK